MVLYDIVHRYTLTLGLSVDIGVLSVCFFYIVCVFVHFSLHNFINKWPYYWGLQIPMRRVI